MSHTRRYSFARITKPSADPKWEFTMGLPAARRLELAGKLKYDGKVVQAEAVEHLFTPTKGCRRAVLRAAAT